MRVLDDTRQIVANLNLYALAIDTHCYDLFDKVFAPDVIANLSPQAQWRSCEELKEGMRVFHDVLDGSQHSFMNHQVIVNGDSANSLAYVIVRLFRPMNSGEGYFEMCGVYDDTHVRTPDGWRIKRRNYCGNQWHGNPRVGGTPELPFEPPFTPLRKMAAAGKVDFLKAVRKK
jgi:hypothetical protein